MTDSADGSPTDHGITQDDLEQIDAFLQKQQYERTVDDLRPSSDD